MTEVTTSAYDDFIIESAEQYLQTVVLIDDRIYESKSGSVASHVRKPSAVRRKPALKRATSTVERERGSTEHMEEGELDEVSFHDVQNSFAKKRIICSLYQPKKTASFGETSEIYKLCSTADVVIVDWALYGDSGGKATTLVGNVVERSQTEIPQQLRLVLIYTLERNLGYVANKIFEDLVERLGEDKVAADPQSAGLVLTTENARVVVLGKRENTPLAQFSDYWVRESDLATRTIWEFSRLASGLLQAIVLRGIANLRKNNLRILGRFQKGLDVAFLTHRALVLPDEAFGQIVPLLTDELRAVLEDTLSDSPLGKPPAVKEILDDWCDKHWKSRSDAKLEIGDGVDGLEFVRDAFCNGPALKKDYSQFQGSKIPGLVRNGEDGSPEWDEKKCNKHNLAGYLLGACSIDDSHERLGSLMSLRAKYGNSRRALHLGVIVRELEGNEDEKRYLLCLQPVCDSVRIEDKSQAFIFCVLKQPEDGKGFTHCIIDGGDNVIKLKYKPNIPGVFVSNFPGTDAVYADKDDKNKPDRFIFKDEKGKGYEWIAELKTEHAQRAAEQFGRELSRVGLTESEWLRIKAKSAIGRST